MNIIMIIILIFGFLILLLLGFIFWNIFNSKKRTIEFKYKGKILGEISFKQSD